MFRFKGRVRYSLFMGLEKNIFHRMYIQIRPGAFLFSLKRQWYYGNRILSTLLCTTDPRLDYSFLYWRANILRFVVLGRICNALSVDTRQWI